MNPSMERPLLARPLTEQRVLALRVADLKPKEHEVCALVWDAWSEHRNLSIRGYANVMGWPFANFKNWLYGRTRGRIYYEGLIERGWLSLDGQRSRTLRPGPRMAGLQGGKVLELA